MITSALILTFCSAITCEEYVVDSNLTRQDCIERTVEESKFIMSLPIEKAYQEYMTSFKAEHMQGKVVTWKATCVKEG